MLSALHHLEFGVEFKASNTAWIVPIDRLLRFEEVVPYQAMLFTVAGEPFRP